MAGLVLGVMPAGAADGEGDYAVRGAGSVSCERYAESIDEGRSDEVRQFLGWIQGYISATNRIREDTYDVVPILRPARVGAMVHNVCRNHPDSRLEEAVVALIEYLASGRERERTEIVRVSNGGGTTAIRVATLDRLKRVLVDEGHLESAEGRYTEKTQEALRRYQAEHGLEETGLPDADTIFAALYGAFSPEQ
ncbi:MAG: peptidoglycan-binding domain-containing protein [Arhodomonas sp.]|nr:peptidoglycan-binding domain-containing protein [Arhodomonas sp.]